MEVTNDTYEQKPGRRTPYPMGDNQERILLQVQAFQESAISSTEVSTAWKAAPLRSENVEYRGDER